MIYRRFRARAGERGQRRLAATTVFALVSIAAVPFFVSCGNAKPESAGREGGDQTGQSSLSQESFGSDPRAAFESSGLLSGLTVDVQTIRILNGSRGSPRAGLALGYGSSLTNAAYAIGELKAEGKSGVQTNELIVTASGSSSPPLPGPVLALTVSGETIVASCAMADGTSMLMGFRLSDATGHLAESWKRSDKSRGLLIPIPGGRIAAGGDDGSVSVFDAADGREVWRANLASQNAPDDMAYTPGYILACSSGSVYAFEEGSGKNVWTTVVGSNTSSLAAGSGVAAIVTRDGKLLSLMLADGSRIVESPGPFDPTVRPLVDSARIFGALRGGGLREIELKAGSITRSWMWRGQSSFIGADSKNLYAGVSGVSGPRLIVASRSGSGELRELPLSAPPFDAPVAVHGSRGGLLLLLRDGSIALATSEQVRPTSPSAMEDAASAPEPASSAILTALGRFKARNPAESPSNYLRFDLFVSGMPVDPMVAFTAFKYEARTSGVETFAAEPAVGGVIIAVYDEEGSELEANIDEIGSRTSVDVRVQKGKTYWIAVGRAAGAEDARFRLYSRSASAK